MPQQSYWSAVERILSTLAPALEGAFAFGQTAVAAVCGGYPYPEMAPQCTFAAFREQFDDVLTACRKRALSAGLTVDEAATVGGQRTEKPYIRIGDGENWVYLLPLDRVPVQSTLRSPILSQARALAHRYTEMESSGKFDALPRHLEATKDVLRYASLDTGVYATLCGYAPGIDFAKGSIYLDSFRREELLPVEHTDFLGVSIPVPKSIGKWTYDPRDANVKATELVQAYDTKSLVALDEFCKQDNLNYFLVGGTLLGAIRHGGFIPWDDDVDVGMIRSDYRKLAKRGTSTANSTSQTSALPKCCRILTRKASRGYHLIYMRLAREDVNYVTEFNKDKPVDRGLWIDVFPFDAVPKNRSIAHVQAKAATFFGTVSTRLARRRLNLNEDVAASAPIANAKDARTLRTQHALSHLFPVTLTFGAYNLCARFFNPFLAGRPSTQYACFLPDYTIFKEDELFPIRKVPFGNTSLAVAAKPEAFLHRQYGDYMAVPKPQERPAGHELIRLETIDDGGFNDSETEKA